MPSISSPSPEIIIQQTLTGDIIAISSLGEKINLSDIPSKYWAQTILENLAEQKNWFEIQSQKQKEIEEKESIRQARLRFKRAWETHKRVWKNDPKMNDFAPKPSYISANDFLID